MNKPGVIQAAKAAYPVEEFEQMFFEDGRFNRKAKALGDCIGLFLAENIEEFIPGENVYTEHIERLASVIDQAIADLGKVKDALFEMV